jgi:nucleolar protein 58
VADEKKFKKVDSDDMYNKFFSSADKTKSILNLLSFQPFEDTADAVAAASACIEGTVSKSLKSFLKKTVKKYPSLAADQETLAVADKSLGQSIKATIPKFPCSIAHDAKTNELFRGIRMHVEELMDEGDANSSMLTAADLRAMQLGLSHSLSRYKLKFSADKVDTMVIQAIGLLDELDKEINIYAMRVKEWYGWHFPEMQKVLGDNAQYSKIVVQCGMRSNIKGADLSGVIEDQSIEVALKEAAEVSMGTDITELDILNIKSLAEQVLSMTEYRAQLFEYLKNRMNAIAPNLSILLGELVGARLISHAGSLMNLAKQPASTVQILGAEKALFRALKTKHDTPKYGLIYHASLIGQTQPQNKGKIARVLAAKAALAIRVDALSDEATPDTTIGYESRAKVEARVRLLEGGVSTSGTTLSTENISKYKPSEAKSSAKESVYNATNDVAIDDQTSPKKEKADKKAKKRKRESSESLKNGGDDESVEKSAKKEAKKAKKAKKEKKSKK